MGTVPYEPEASLANLPTDGEKAALAGTTGAPGAANKYVTETDPALAGLAANLLLSQTNNWVIAKNSGTPVGNNVYVGLSEIGVVLKCVGETYVVNDNANDFLYTNDASAASKVYVHSTGLQHKAIATDLYVKTSSGRAIKIAYSATADSNPELFLGGGSLNSDLAAVQNLPTSSKFAFGVLNA